MAAIELSDASVRFKVGGTIVNALRSITFSMSDGEFVSVIGSNGAGKSTLINVVAGAVRLSSGTVSIAGQMINKMPEYKRARYIARVFQGTRTGVCADVTVAENLMLAYSRGKRRSIWRPAVKRQQVNDARDVLAEYGVGLENTMKRLAGALSGGQQQLLTLVMAGISHPNVLLLDEHTSALDPKMSQVVMAATESIVRDQRLTALMVTHNMRHATDYGDRAVIMDRGSIVGTLNAAERQSLGEEGLISRFRALTGGGPSDEMLA